MTLLFTEPTILPGTATFSPCMKYRYSLTRQWSDAPGLLVPGDPVGADNDIHALGACNNGQTIVIACWGSHRKSKRLTLLVATRAAMFRTMMSLNGVALKCFGTNADGQPKHTLYLPSDAPLVDFR